MGPGSRQVLQAVPVLVLAVALVGCAGGLPPRDIGIASRSYGGIPAGIDSPFSSTTVRPVETDPVQTDPPLITLGPSTYPPTPATVAPEDLAPTGLPDPDFSPRIAWLDERTLAVVTFGSSSCPSAPAALDMSGPDTVDLALKRTGGEMCTADMSATTFEIDDPDELDPSVRYTVTIDRGFESVLEPVS